ncbi:helix-turn-helix domain-containing protein [Budviciaceae bacterium BWR-B9]|uniref:Helix-turn-helix domain-containing protein n=1 Tax=Limnobaculum allomyrinae TaxID=2791986 RepID=A0ABS1ITM1_9GAMM|nr:MULTISPECIES: helix-turn-helix transcriptional regulator [Limnobaculum]MBK5145095.1 helix-turn-helix domain-containing protein [Limnobaculum allomyrinae]MBV7692926.1 helix-turn-helix domain-containing protein [Limnobaculum sp. M2-1]
MEKTVYKDKDHNRFIPMPGINRFAERLKLAMGNMSNVELARLSGVSESAIRGYLKGKSFPAIDKIQAISIACCAPLEWLITGDCFAQLSEMSAEQYDEGLAFIMKNLTSSQRQSLINAIIRFGIDGILSALNEPSVSAEFASLSEAEKEQVMRLFEEVKKGAPKVSEKVIQDNLTSKKRKVG